MPKYTQTRYQQSRSAPARINFKRKPEHVFARIVIWSLLIGLTIFLTGAALSK